MEDRFAVSKAQIVFALILPLAVLMGVLLSEPAESSNMLLMLIVFGVLSIPIFMRWYHPLLIICWNACINPYFLPGRPYLWMILAFIGLAIAIANRFTSPDAKFVMVPEINWALIGIAVVTLATAWLRGGFGMRAFGGESYGGKGYFYILAAVVGYFALVSRRIQPALVLPLGGLFFLSGITALVPNIAYLLGPKVEFLFYLFPPEFAMEQARADFSVGQQLGRVFGLTVTSQALGGFLLARYGIRGVFDLSKPWRLGLMLVALFASIYCGFRSVFGLFVLTVVAQMYFERLFRPRVLLPLVGAALLAFALLASVSTRLPLSIQRTLSFLPVDINPMIRMDAEASSTWRFEMWKRVWAMVPQYLVLGKGLALDPGELAFMAENARRGHIQNYETALYVGDYHSGPLSLIIPFGIGGGLVFVFFLVVSLRFLYRVYRSGDPQFKVINTFLLAYFVARIIQFCFVFGGFYIEIGVLASLVGFSVSINGSEPYRSYTSSSESHATLGETFPSATLPTR